MDISVHDLEFIEVTNVSSGSTVNLAGMQIAGRIQFTFGGRTLRPGVAIVVVRNQAAFELRYGPGRNIAGQYGGTPQDDRLSNAGEHLRLVDTLGGTVQSFRYDDLWQLATDGSGHSLEIVDMHGPLAMWSVAAGWRRAARPDRPAPPFPATQITTADSIRRT